MRRRKLIQEDKLVASVGNKLQQQQCSHPAHRGIGRPARTARKFSGFVTNFNSKLADENERRMLGREAVGRVPSCLSLLHS
ncbi:hypothetical protein E2C01_095465 [Portunus trituberculatus]|uniref:Uncharacterized protein n=1 Tax=Portunus trituberculatus TaxID=210409 RepID=A0A5B7K093_PORTR|nr:hypothetical protein [Portunus trituberculatus]